MALKAFKRIQFKTFDLSQFQANVAELFQQLSLAPFLTGALVKNQAIATTGTAVGHGLGQIPQGYFVLTKNANSTIWQVSSTDKTITLKSSAAVTCDLWIF